MPQELRDWKPAKDPKLPPYNLPPPDDTFWEIEAMLACGYRVREWHAEDPMVRGRLVAHHHEKRMREAHLEDWRNAQLRKASEKDGKRGTENPMMAMRRAWMKPKDES